MSIDSTHKGTASHQIERPDRWTIVSPGVIRWDIASGDAHRDFVEMSGEQMAFLIRYGVDEAGIFSVSHLGIWPMLRFHPNLTGSHLRVSFGEDSVVDDDPRFRPGVVPAMAVRNTHPTTREEVWTPLVFRASQCLHDRGVFRVNGELNEAQGNPRLAFRRAIFPSTLQPCAFDTVTITNVSDSPVDISISGYEQLITTPPARGTRGSYQARRRMLDTGLHGLLPGESTTVTTVLEAKRLDEPWLDVDPAGEERARTSRMTGLLEAMQLQTPEPILDCAFAFAKMRTTESIFRTKGGLMHAPGGGTKYYAAIWANDQAEYANPFFAMLGDDMASEAAINSFRHFARFMNPDYTPIPSSIIGEGHNIWNGAGDRGDMAMIAYGAARFALAHGDTETGEALWPLVEWCLEYLDRQLTPDGVIASDSDELEGRFPAGKANLCTSALGYDALRSAAMLGRELGKPRRQLDLYAERAESLHKAIESYFGASVEGHETYRYFDLADLGEGAAVHQADVLRAWIAIPLTMGILERSGGTIDAMFSPRLWTKDGLATEAGQTTIWDRSTLYGLRGAFAAGATSRALEHLLDYSARRLLGDHVPYPFEAYPEGGKAQLAAESALYCRVFTEGLFGLRPTGFQSFDLTPRLPEHWPSMALRRVKAFGTVFDLVVTRTGADKFEVELTPSGEPPQRYGCVGGQMLNLRLQ